MKNYLFLVGILFFIIAGCNNKHQRINKNEEKTSFVQVLAAKMNVLYIGVRNPLNISVAGIPMDKLIVTCAGSDCRLIPKKDYGYEIMVGQPGQTTVTVSGEGLSPIDFEFRVKQIPNPRPCFGSCNTGTMSADEFKAHAGVYAKLENFDFDTRCIIDGFFFEKRPKCAESSFSTNRGGRFNKTSKRIRNTAEPGDLFYFTSIKSRCPGDRVARLLPDIVVRIK